MLGDLIAALILCPLGFHQWTSGEYLLGYPDGGSSVCGRRR